MQEKYGKYISLKTFIVFSPLAIPQSINTEWLHFWSREQYSSVEPVIKKKMMHDCIIKHDLLYINRTTTPQRGYLYHLEE